MASGIMAISKLHNCKLCTYSLPFFLKLNQNNSFYNTQINVGWLDDWLVVFYAPSTARSSLAKNVKLGFYTVSTANRTPGSSLHYRCDTPAPLRLMLYLKLLHMHFINKFD